MRFLLVLVHATLRGISWGRSSFCGLRGGVNGRFLCHFPGEAMTWDNNLLAAMDAFHGLRGTRKDSFMQRYLRLNGELAVAWLEYWGTR
jgi:hypothetical protein